LIACKVAMLMLASSSLVSSWLIEVNTFPDIEGNFHHMWEKILHRHWHKFPAIYLFHSYMLGSAITHLLKEYIISRSKLMNLNPIQT